MGAAGFLGVTLLCWLGDFWWIAELVVNFRLQYAVAGLLLLGFCLLMGRWRLVLGVALLTALHCWAVFQANVPNRGSPGVKDFTVATFNASAWSRNRTRLRRFLQNQDSDIIFITEMTPRLEGTIEDYLEQYPYVLVEPSWNGFGFALMSKFEIVAYERPRFNNGGVPYLSASLQLPTTMLNLVGVHLYSPIKKSMVEIRNRQLAELGALLSQFSAAPTILLGDLNVSPFSSHYKRLLRATQLSDKSSNWNFARTWPSWSRIWRIRIDHCLSNEGLALTNRYSGRRFSSDHLPLFCDYKLAHNVVDEK